SAIYKKVPKVLADMSSTSYDLSNIIYNFWSSLLSNPYYYMRLIAADYKGGNFIFRFVDQYGLIPSNKEMGKINVSRIIYDSIYKAYADRDDIEEIYNFCSSVVHNLTPADLVSDPEDQRYMGHLLEFLKRMANVEGDFEYVPEDVMKAEIEKLMSIFKDRQKLEKTLEENPDYVDDYFEANLFRGYDVYNYDPQKHRGFWCKIYTLYQSYIVNINENEQPIEGHWLKEPNPDKAYEKIIEITPKFFKEEEWRNFLKHLLVRSIASYTDLKVDIVDSNGNALDYRLFVSKMKEELVKILDTNADTSKIFWGISKLDVETVFMNNYSVIVSDASLASESEKSQLFNRFIQNRTGLLNALNLLGASWNNATIAATFGKERFFFNKGNK
ncbi:MAG: hypothetical protein NZM44_01695, partial [Candidatus Calescibacterium sp.]|nr:hypothetical protein [Candidatus Calescibacterium sp.]